MPLREFTDRDGTKWRAWAVILDGGWARMTLADYLGEFQDGWLCFECQSERRRLARYPQDWGNLPDHALAQLLDQALVVEARRHRLSGDVGEVGEIGNVGESGDEGLERI